MNVFDITAEHAALMMEIEEAGGEITPELATRLNINENELATKVRAYYYIIKTAESQIKLAKDEQERLDNVKTTKENLITRLKKTVDIALEEFGTIKKDAKVKSLDLGDLKVWQKKSESLSITGEIDDPRFCEKQYVFTLRYSTAEEFLKYLEGTTFADEPSIKTIVDKDSLKSWLLEHEQEHKELRQKASEITEVEFENSEDVKWANGYVETQEDKDLQVILATELKHNSTVVFK